MDTFYYTIETLEELTGDSITLTTIRKLSRIRLSLVDKGPSQTDKCERIQFCSRILDDRVIAKALHISSRRRNCESVNQSQLL